jgi:hypothetical protein
VKKDSGYLLEVILKLLAEMVMMLFNFIIHFCIMGYSVFALTQIILSGLVV